MSSTLLAGSRTTAGYVDATGTDARFNFPAGIETDGTYLYVTEYMGDRIRRVHPTTGVTTTVVTLGSGARPMGIQRHATSGKFYVACSGFGTVRVYNSDWTFNTSLSIGGTHFGYHLHVNAAETTIYVSGEDGGDLGDRIWKMNIDGTGLVSRTMGSLGVPDSILGPDSGLTDPGGMIEYGGYFYFTLGRFKNGLYRTDIGFANPTGRILEFDQADGVDSPRTIRHLRDNIYYWTFGPSRYQGDNRGGGITNFDFDTMTNTKTPKDHFQPNLAYISDAVWLGAHYYTVNSLVLQGFGFPNLETESGGPHSVERIDTSGWSIHFIRMG